jgi:hypothetical protein
LANGNVFYAEASQFAAPSPRSVGSLRGSSPKVNGGRLHEARCIEPLAHHLGGAGEYYFKPRQQALANRFLADRYLAEVY